MKRSLTKNKIHYNKNEYNFLKQVSFPEKNVSYFEEIIVYFKESNCSVQLLIIWRTSSMSAQYLLD